MKIAISSQGPQLDSQMDSRFGRAPFFIIWDNEKSELEVLDNKDLSSFSNGVGVKAAQKVVDSGAELLVTGHVGPKADQVLKAAGIGIKEFSGSTIQEALNSCLNS